MTIDKIRAQMISSIWQAVAQSGVDLSSISQADQEKLVGGIADRVMVSMNTVLDEIAKPDGLYSSPQKAGVELPEATQPGAEFDEEVLWEDRPFLSLVEKYVLTNERIKIVHGMLSRQVENYELVRIQDIDFKQNVSERVLGIGDIFIRGHDPSHPVITLRNVSGPEEVYEKIRRAWMESRKRHGLQFREYM
jgi:hypothetical protein